MNKPLLIQTASWRERQIYFVVFYLVRDWLSTSIYPNRNETYQPY